MIEIVFSWHKFEERAMTDKKRPHSQYRSRSPGLHIVTKARYRAGDGLKAVTVKIKRFKISSPIQTQSRAQGRNDDNGKT